MTTFASGGTVLAGLRALSWDGGSRPPSRPTGRNVPPDGAEDSWARDLDVASHRAAPRERSLWVPDPQRDPAGQRDRSEGGWGDSSDSLPRAQPIRPTKKSVPKPLLLAGLLMLMALVVIVASVIVLASPGVGASKANAPTTATSPSQLATLYPYRTFTPTATPSGQVTAGAWQPVTVAGITSGQTLAFGASDPAIFYMCGYDNNNAVHFAVTHDSGHSWYTLFPNVPNLGCALSVDPTNAFDLLTIGRTCNAPCSSASTVLYRSIDGGADWSLQSLPDTTAAPVSVSQNVIQWSAGTAYVALMGKHVLARSVNGGPFSYDDPLIAPPGTGAPAQMSLIDGLLATKTAVFAGGEYVSGQTSLTISVESLDRGQSWQPVIFNVNTMISPPLGNFAASDRTFAPENGSPLSPSGSSNPSYMVIGVGDNGSTLLAVDVTVGTPAISTDNGNSFLDFSLPDLGTPFQISNLFQTPNGDLFALTNLTNIKGPPVLYKLPATPKSQWVQISLDFSQTQILAITYSQQTGAAIAVWGSQFGGGFVTSQLTVVQGNVPGKQPGN